MQQLGSGATADVYRCKFMGEDVAVKLFRNVLEEDAQGAQKELELLFELRHPNIIGICGWFQMKQGGGRAPKLGIIMELCSRGELRKVGSKLKSR